MIRMLIIDLFILALLAYGVFLFLQFKEGEKDHQLKPHHADGNEVGRKQPAA